MKKTNLLMKFKLCIVIFLLTGSLSKCKSTDTSNNLVSKKFIEYIKNENYDKARSLFCKKMDEFNPQYTNANLRKTHDLLMKYDIPSEDKWHVEYDTSRGPLKIKKYTIPIYKEAYIELYFEKNKKDSIYIYSLFYDI
jgi:hypothetical protein